MQIHVAKALEKLSRANEEFIPLFHHGSLVLEVYKPGKEDKQKPHNRDEVYIVISGNGSFFNDGKTTIFQPGDFLFVAAGKEHRFINYTVDFATWVIFYGSEGGE